MHNEDTYHAAMLFVKQLEADLAGADLAAWVRSELSPKRHCHTCKENKELTDFYPGTFYKYGRGRTQNRYECKGCASAKNLAKYHRLKQETTLTKAA